MTAAVVGAEVVGSEVVGSEVVGAEVVGATTVTGGAIAGSGHSNAGSRSDTATSRAAATSGTVVVTEIAAAVGGGDVEHPATNPGTVTRIATAATLVRNHGKQRDTIAAT